MEVQNPNPEVFQKVVLKRDNNELEDDENTRDPFDSIEVFEILRNIKDPEHPLTLEELKVIQPENITVDNENNSIDIRFTPTIPHCTMATLIGLTLRVTLMRCLPQRFKVEVSITPGTHQTEDGINKQLQDKERIQAALENPNLSKVVNTCMAGSSPFA